ncbi:hypothetical protein K4K56_008763 [Colletotrichum sp. SAR 10_98]|nr:hypothetical protein K4K56_008763 [Colletotrichum sp. SAR 10_98]
MSNIPSRRRDTFKRRCKLIAKYARISARWLAENLNFILNHHLNKDNILKLTHLELLVFGGSTRRALSGSALGVAISSALTAACPLFGLSIGINLWQTCISFKNRRRVKREIKRRRSEDPSFTKVEEEYKKKKRHHPVLDVVLGCALKAAVMAVTLGITGFSDIIDAFATKFCETVAEHAGASAIHAFPLYKNINIPDFISMFQHANDSGIWSSLPDMPADFLAADDLTDVSAAFQHDNDLISAAIDKSSPNVQEISRAEQIENEHPRIMRLDHAMNHFVAPGSLIGQKLSQHVADESVKLGMEAKWDDLIDLHDKWDLPISKIVGLGATTALVNEAFQPIPHMVSLVAEKEIDDWNRS